MKINKVIYVLLILTSLTACSDDALMKKIETPSALNSGDIFIQPDVYVVDDQTYETHTGVIVVPENRSKPDSRLLEIPFIQIHSNGSNVLEPIFFLNGGPGNPNLNTYHFVTNLIENHDIVLVGYRGVDGAVKLDLPEVDEFFSNMKGDLTEKAMLDEMASAYAKGAKRLQNEGIDTDGYIITEVLNDVDLVRTKLEYSKINLFSASYGTRLAMIYDWMFPNVVHRSAMIGVNPPGRFEWRPEVMDQHLKYYADLYKRDSLHGDPNVNIAEIIRKNSREIPESWLFIPIKKGYVLMSTFMMLYSTNNAAKLFDAWIAADKGDWSGIAMISLSTEFMLQGQLLWGDLASKSSSTDYDFDPELDLMKEFMPENSIIGAPGSLLGIGAMGWPAKHIPDSLRTVQYSDTRTLLINGNIDVSTPEQFGRTELLPFLKNGTQVIISEAAHTPDIFGKQRPALDYMLKKFFKTGEVDNSKYHYEPLNFKVGLSFQSIIKLSLAAILIIIVLIGFLVRFLVLKRSKKKLKKLHSA